MELGGMVMMQCRADGQPKPEIIDGLTIDLRPPVQVRRAFTERHDTLMRSL